MADPPPVQTGRSRRTRALIAALLLLIASLAAGAVALLQWGKVEGRGGEPQPAAAGCNVPAAALQYVKNGWVDGRSGDVLTIERFPNMYRGRHSSPWPYTMEVPLALYGPGFVRAGATPRRQVSVADIAPTIAELLHFDAWPARDGTVLEEALLPRYKRNGVPKLVFTLVWDGGGDNVLERWAESWPELKKMMRRGTAYERATVGSSPSNTPPVHATIGTGAFPARHGLPDTKLRTGNRVDDPWPGASPKYLRVKTIADAWDLANENEPLIGMLARDQWHLGMVGHGAYLPGADKDIAVLDQLGGTDFRANERYYELPEYVLGHDGLDPAIDDLDARDGRLDNFWLGHPLRPYDGSVRYTPAWSVFQTAKIIQILKREQFGADDVSDLFYANYKSIDLTGHQYGLVEPELRENLEEQDRQLPRLIEALDRSVGKDNYVLIFTADHGVAPVPEDVRGWPINMGEIRGDIDRHFDKTTPEVSLVLAHRGYQVILDKEELRRNDVTPGQVARWLSNYTVRQNINKGTEVPSYFEGREDERIFLTAMTPDKLDAALECARTLVRRKAGVKG